MVRTVIGDDGQTFAETEDRWPRQRLVFARAALALLAVVAFAGGMNGRFLSDDAGSIPGNGSLEQLWPPGVPLTPPPAAAISGRPIANLSLAINHAINRNAGLRDRITEAGYSTVGYHAGNLLLHIATGLLLFGLLRRTLARQRFDDRWQRDANGIALAIVALWLVHPLQTEAVYYLVQRTELLGGFFLVATLYAALRATSEPRRGCTWQVVSVVACLLGLGSKEVVAVAPLLVVLYDRAFIATSWRALTARGSGSRRAFHAALLGTLLPFFALLLRDPSRNHTAGFSAGMPWYEYLYSQCWAIGHYLRLAAWPSRLVFDYGNLPVMDSRGIPGALLLIGAGGATLFAWGRVAQLGWLAFTGAWFFLILAPSSSILPIITEIAAERRFYLPLLAVIVVAVVMVDVVARQVTRNAHRAGAVSHWRRGVIALWALAVAGCATMTFRRGADYSGAERMWRDVVAKAPGNPRGHFNLGAELLFSTPPRVDDAEHEFRASAALDSMQPSAWFNLGEIAMSRGDRAAARALYEHALRVNPSHGKALDRLGRLAAAEGLNGGSAAESSDALDAARAGLAFAEVGRRDQAVDQLQHALDAAGDDARVFTLTGRALLRLNMLPDAVSVLEHALTLNGRDAEALAALGAAKASLGDYAAARSLFDRAIAISPGYPAAVKGRELLKSAAGR